jgi:hypothetical protein
MTKIKLYVFETWDAEELGNGIAPIGFFAETLKEAKTLLKNSGEKDYGHTVFTVKKGVKVELPTFIE